MTATERDLLVRLRLATGENERLRVSLAKTRREKLTMLRRARELAAKKMEREVERLTRELDGARERVRILEARVARLDPEVRVLRRELNDERVLCDGYRSRCIALEEMNRRIADQIRFGYQAINGPGRNLVVGRAARDLEVNAT